MADASYPSSGQEGCFDATGLAVPCAGSGQDGEFRPGRPWPAPRFSLVSEALALDRLTGLIWPRLADPGEWPMPHGQALAFIDALNRDAFLGRTDWRLPRRRELLSLVSLAHARPALPPGHPFARVFQHWHWTASPSAVAPGHVWRVHLEGGRMFSGQAEAAHMVWPVAGTSWLMPESPQQGLLSGRPWPEPRFQASRDEVFDRLSGLVWSRRVLPALGEASWPEALEAAGLAGWPWRLPSIFELETLIDVSRAWPALPFGHPFKALDRLIGQADLESARASGLGLWSGTSSGYDPAWAWVLYVGKGAVGVGHKPGRHFKFLLTRGPARQGG